MKKLDDETIQELSAFRHELHQIAEVSGREHQTSRKIRDLLQQFQPDRLLEDIGGYGIVAVFEGEQDGPSVMIRCELDALPIQEENEVPWYSEKEGVSHKCGHDGHMAIVAGVARYMESHRPRKGSVSLLFQPAEETGQGAEKVLEDENFTGLEPDYIFALHNLPGYPLNQIIVRDDIFASASRGLLVKLKGETSHAAHPENGRNPAPALSQLIQVFSSFPQFFTTLDESSKVTVVQAGLGEVAFGTSPGYAELRVTFRTYENKVMEKLCSRAEQVVRGTAETHALDFSVEWKEIFKTTVNDGESNRIIRTAAGNAGYQVVQKKNPFAWSEDFGRFTARYRGAMFGIGAGEDQPQLHSSYYDFPDPLIEAGCNMFIDITDQILGLKK